MASNRHPRRHARRSSALRSFVMCTVLIILFVAAVYLLAGPGHSGGSASVTPSPVPSPDATPAPTPEPTPVPVRLGQTPDAGQEYQDRLVFLGDSITYQMASHDLLPFTQVWVPVEGTLALFNCPVALINYYPEETPDEPRELSIAECAAARKPEYLVITLGINGVALLDEAEFKRYYQDVITSVQENSPETKIICQSIFHVVDSLVPEGIDNAGVNAANVWIEEVAAQTGARYLNTHEALTDAAGGLVADYSPWDGYHLTVEAMELVLQYVRTHAWL